MWAPAEMGHRRLEPKKALEECLQGWGEEEKPLPLARDIFAPHTRRESTLTSLHSVFLEKKSGLSSGNPD